MTQKIALVDDDRNITTSLSLALKAEGYAVDIYHDGEEGYQGLTSHPVDLAILDIKMPRLDGMELLTRLRETSDLPVIFLTSKDDEIDEVLGLRLGADDYIAKPFSQRLLFERIRAVLRRRQPIIAKDNKISDPDLIIRGDLALDDKRHMCTWKNQTVTLTVTEYLLLKSLALSPGHVKTRDQLINDAYGESIYVDDRTIDTHIKRVRRKFREQDKAFDGIETLYGLGYRYKIL